MLSTAKAPKGSTRSRRQALLAGAAIAVALTALGRADRAQAQSVAFQGTPTVSTGSVAISRGSTDTFTVNTTQAVIDWTSFDQATGGGPIAFLPNGSTALYQNSENISDFTVLNRIVPTDQTRGIRLDGTIQSRVNGQAGGSVWFFSPGGIMAGPTAVFDVGNLVLTTNAIDTAGGLFGSNGEIRFRGASGSLSTVEIQAGAQITARNQSLSNAYVALVAPRIVQNGTIDTFGSAAYVAAEQADIRIDPGNGLFDITVTTGTSGGDAIVHNGTTTGPQQFTGANRIYMATIAKNDAVTMLVNGSVGYTPAASASVDNGVVVLAAGYNVVGGATADAPANGNGAAITSSGGNFTSDVTAHATGAVTVSPNSFGTVAFSGDATLEGDAGVSVGTDTNETITVGGNLSLISGGGDATLFANFTPNSESFQGSVTIDGDLLIDASATGADNLSGGGVGGSATAGTALLDIAGGAVTVARNVTVAANAQGGVGETSGSSTGGTARIQLAGGSLTVGNDPDNISVGLINVRADALASERPDFFNLTLVGGHANGGAADILVNGGGALTANGLNVTANAFGSAGGQIDGTLAGGGSGGDAAGGLATISVGADSALAVHDVTVNAIAQAGGASFIAGNTGGAGAGGTAVVESTGGAIAVRDGIFLDAGGFSGFSDISGEANGGTTRLTATGGGSIAGGFANLSASAGGDFGDSVGGSAFAGMVTVGAENGSIALGDLFMGADADAGSGSATGGEAIGGGGTLYARPGGAVSISGNLNVDVDADGGNGDTGGDGNGGLISITAQDGSLVLGSSVFLSASGDGGASFDGAPTSGSGGIIEISTVAGTANTASISFGSLFADADGEVFSGAEGFALTGPNGETPGAGTSGLGTGGEVTITVAAGTMTGDQLSVSADGRGGDADNGGIAGDGEGGIARFLLTGGSATIGSIGLSASGDGGRGAFGGPDAAATAGGNGFGGTVEMTLSSGSLTTSGVSLSANGEGGDGGDSFDVDSGNGGKGFGGEAAFTAEGTAMVTLGSLGIETEGFGGDGGFVGYNGGEGCFECGYGDPGALTFNDIGGRGGDGYGGHSFVELTSGTLAIGSVFTDASGVGGEGGIQGISFNANPNGTGVGGLGGSGFGGQSMVTLGLGDIGDTSLDLRSEGVGGEGGFGLNGGSGGIGTGGMAMLIVDNAAAQLINVALSAEADGGDGQRGFVRNGGNGGEALGGTVEVRSRGASAALTLVNLDLDASADGGIGGDGIAAEGFTADTGGQGGAGGDATGGNANIVAELGQLMLGAIEGQSFFAIDVEGDGGSGGRGGNGAAPGATGGVGGAGGSGTGGAVSFESLGGQLVAGDLFVSANGFGGEGGFGGSGPPDPGNPEANPPVPPSDPIPASAGANGFGAGGLIHLKATNATGAAGAGISFGNTVLEATGFDPFSEQPDIAGRIMIDVGADSTIQLASLQAQALGTAPTLASRNFSFFGTLDNPDGVLLFDFGVSADTTVTLRTYSYAGGTNLAGQTITAGGFDPILALFNGTGQLINQNDDGGSNVPADPVTGSHYDTFLQVPVTAGNYQVSVTAYSNFARGPNLSDGFDGGGSFNGRTQQFAFDVLGADTSSGPGAALKTFQLNTTGSGLLSIGGNATIDVGGDASFRAAGVTGAAPGGLQVGGNLSVNAAGSIDFGAVNNGAFDIGGLLGLSSDNAIGFSHTTPGAEPTIHAGQVLIDSGGMVTGGAGAVLLADGNIDVFAAGDVAAGGASFTSTGGDIDIDVAGNINIGSADAFDTLALTGLTVTAGSLTAGSMGDGTPENVIDGIGVGARGAIDIGSITSAVDVGVASLEGGISIDSLSAGDDAIIVGGGGVTLGNSTAAGVTYIAGVQLLDIVSGGEFTGVEDLGRVDGDDLLAIAPPATGGDVTVTGTLATGDLRLNAGGDFDLFRVEATNSIVVDGNGNGSAGTLIAGGLVDVNSSGDTTLGTIQAGDDIDVNAGATTTIESATAGGFIDVNGGANTSIGSATAGSFFEANALFDTSVGSATASGAIDLNAGEDLDVGSLESSGDIALNARNNLTADDLLAGGVIEISAGDDIVIGTAVTRGSSESGFGSFGHFIEVDAGGALTLTSATAAGSISLEGGTIDAGALRADERIAAFADTSLGIDSATTTGAAPAGEGFEGRDITLFTSNGGIDLGDIRSAGNVVIGAEGGGLVANLLRARENITVTADNDVSINTAITSVGGSSGDPQSSSFFYADFADALGLQLNGSAAIANDGSRGVLRLTPAIGGQSGSAFRTTAITLGQDLSFSTKFTFNLNQYGGLGGGADGFVFTVQTVSNTSGGGGGGIGYAGLPNSVGVEFDTFDNGGGDGFSNNHVGLDLNGDVNSVALVNLNNLASPITLNSATDLTAFVDYDGATDQLEVRLNNSDVRPANAILTQQVDLADALDSQNAFVGFTSGTGAGFANHDIVNWQFADSFNPLPGGSGGGGGNITINAGGNVSVGTADAGGMVSITAGGDLASSTMIRGGGVDVDVAGAVTAASVIATGGSGGAGELVSGTFVVDAQLNSAAGGVPVDSIAVSEGNIITISSSSDDLWSAGGLPRFSDANGLVGPRLATAADDSGQAPGTQIGADFGTLTMDGFSAPFGSLVGDVGGSKALLGANNQVQAPGTGTLKLSYWDSNAGDNSGSISFNLSASSAASSGSGNISIRAGGDLSLGVAQATGDVALTAFGGAINVTDDLSAGGVVTAVGEAVSLNALGALDVDLALATDGDLELTSAGDLFVDQARSAGDIRLTSSGASVILGDISIGAEGGQNEEVFQRSAGFTAASVTAGDRGPGDILVDAVLDIRANGDVTASRNLSMDAGRDIQINGLAFGTNIDLSSADISIGGEGGRVGLSTLTQSVSFTNTALDTQTFIGGTGGEGGYRLDSDEIGRVFTGGDVSVTGANASQSTGANNDVMLQTMTVRGQTGSGETAGQIGNSGRFTVQSPGAIVIAGDVDFAGLADTAGVTLDADRQIRLAAESGSLSLRGANNALAGELILSSDMIIAGTADAIADVGAATSTDAINDRLGQSEGTASDDGFFAANTIRVDAGNGFFVQNTGVAGGDNASRRGLTVGSGGLSITTGGAATRIVINGRQMNADGSFTTGADFIARTTISTQESSSAQFDQRSTINGCLIAGGAACGVVEPPPPPMPTFDPTPSIRDVVSVVEGDEGATGTDQGESVFPTSLVSLADFETFGFEPLIDEPVTGAGNDDLWIAPEEGEQEQCTNAAGERVPCQR